MIYTINTALLILIITFGIFLIVELMIYYIPYSVIISKTSKKALSKRTEKSEKEGVSVILCARNEGYNLEQFLPLILQQDYPKFEVIVVDDGSLDSTVEIINDFQKLYNNLYLTSIPAESVSKNRKKLALTVGIKAAKYDLLLFTDADCRPYSSKWIDNMVYNFDEKTEFVIGYGSFAQDNSLINKLLCFDSLLSTMQYMGYTHFFTPYMAVGRNLAYKKSTFTNHKGFAKLLNITSGEDDLFINIYGNKANTKIEPLLAAKTISMNKVNFKDWFYQKARKLTTLPLYKPNKIFAVLCEPLTRSILYILAIIGLAIFPTNIYALCFFLGGLLIKWISLLIMVNLTSKRYKEHWYGISAILFDIILPIINLYLLIYNKATKNKILRWK